MGDDLREVYVHTSEKRGREQFFVKEYNEPTENYLEIDTTNESIVESAKKVLDYAKNSR
jgi:adenylylsulfate kinase-like enzyme